MSAPITIHSEPGLQLPYAIARALIATETALGVDPNLRVINLPIESAQTTSFAELAFHRAEAAITLVSASYIQSAASAPETGSNSVALTVALRDGAGGAASALASATCNNTHQMSAFQSFSLGTLAATAVTAGKVLTFATTVTGTATLPAGFVQLVYRVN